MDKRDKTPGENTEVTVESNQINVSKHKNEAFYIYLGKRTLEKFDEIYLHALGNAISVCVNSAEKLVRNGYADYIRLETKYIEVEESRRRRPDQGETPSR